MGRPAIRPSWEEGYLVALRKLGTKTRAAAAVGMSRGAPDGRSQRNAEFRRAQAEALAAFAASGRKAQALGAKPAPMPQRIRDFLAALAETSNVKASADAAVLSTREVYRLRRTDPQFAADWRAALHEGYEHLEMEVLAYLRGQQTGTKLDTANAIRLLAAHRQTIAEIRALREDDDEQAVLASIDALIDRMRGARPPARPGGNRP